MISWIVPYSFYLLYFVAPKPHHYWLPAMLLFFSGAMNVYALSGMMPKHPFFQSRKWWILKWVITAGWTVFLCVQVWQNLSFDYARYIEVLFRETAF